MGRIQKKKTTAAKKKSMKARGEGAVSTGRKMPAGAAQPPRKSKTVALKRPAAGTKAPAVKKEKNFIDKSLQFLREVRVELKKVTWPTRKQTLGSTAVVIILVMIISLFLGLVDLGLSNLIRVILQ